MKAKIDPVIIVLFLIAAPVLVFTFREEQKRRQYDYTYLTDVDKTTLEEMQNEGWEICHAGEALISFRRLKNHVD